MPYFIFCYFFLVAKKLQKNQGHNKQHKVTKLPFTMLLINPYFHIALNIDNPIVSN